MNTKLIPFDIEKAKAGAKIVCRDGKDFETILLEGRGRRPIIGYRSDNVTPLCWLADGSFVDEEMHHADLMLSISTFPDPPEGEEWHNAHDLTPEQVGEGYRLWLKSEVKERDAAPFIEIWHEGSETWCDRVGFGYHDNNRSESYRAPIDTPFHWDKPKEPVYRPFTFDESKGYIGKLVQWKDGRVAALLVSCSDTLISIGTTTVDYENLLTNYTFLDGSPCGVLVEN